MNPVPIIALLTDFGLTDAYAGTMKGVLLSICPAARLIDLTHAIEPQNVRQAAYVLLTAIPYFPTGTIFLVVVDPGVGTAREPIAVQADHGTYVAPNNGVLSYALRRTQVQQTVILENLDYQLASASKTFHGRDIFSPAAAHLANGVAITALGPALPELVWLDDPRLEVAPPRIRGEVLHIDHFGNVITSIGELIWTGSNTLQLVPQFGPYHPPLPMLDAQTSYITIGSQSIRAISPTYGSGPPGIPIALVGSSGQLEIGINQGNAARSLGVCMGDPVTLLLSP
jgi:S-adenosylmethionine hydrolase